MAEVVAPSRGDLRPPPDVRLEGGFWGGRQQLNRSKLIPHCFSWESRLGWIDNFLDPHAEAGREFADSDVYKLVEAMAWDGSFDAQVEAIVDWTDDPDGAQIFVTEVPDPENFGVVVYGEDGRVTDIVEKAGIVDARYDAPPSSHAVVGLYCYPPDVFEVIDRLEPSSRGELEITDVNRHYALAGRLRAREVEGWWEDAGKHWQHLAEIGRRVEETGVNKVS